MMTDWNAISEPLQLHLATEALSKAAEIIAEQAEGLAEEFEIGGLSDRGGADALRLLAAIVRATRGSLPETGNSAAKKPRRKGRTLSPRVLN
jgi:hypothetical protein